MVNPVGELMRGARAFLEGLRWLRKHPFYMILLTIPVIFGLGMTIGAWILFIEYKTDLVRAVLFEPGSGWAWTFLYLICKALLYLAVLVFTLLLGLMTANVVAAPIYEVVSVAIERDLRGGVQEISFWRSLRLIPEELKKVLLIVLVSLALFVIPGLNVMALFVTAFLLGWDAYDYPMARRGWPLRTRLEMVRRDFWSVLGLGLWLIIPVVHIFLVPLAIAGGTLLNLERIDRLGRSTAQPGRSLSGKAARFE
jgi:CysZ protein